MKLRTCKIYLTLKRKTVKHVEKCKNLGKIKRSRLDFLFKSGVNIFLQGERIILPKLCLGGCKSVPPSHSDSRQNLKAIYGNDCQTISKQPPSIGMESIYRIKLELYS